MQCYSINMYTICPRSSDPFYIVSYYIKWVTTSWTYSIYLTEGTVTLVPPPQMVFRPCLKRSLDDTYLKTYLRSVRP